MALKTVHNEAYLLEEIAKGNEQAFEELFMSYHNQLGEYVQIFTQSCEMTEEIVQDVFVKVWTNRTKLCHIEKFTSYLFILTRNYTLNTLRKIVNERKYKAQYLTQVENGNLSLDLEDSAYSDAGFQILLDKAIIQLPPQQQRVFLLRMQGFKNPEIAIQMGLATDSVKKYYKWALEAIRKDVYRCEILSLMVVLLIQIENR